MQMYTKMRYIRVPVGQARASAHQNGLGRDFKIK